jgi:O-methyltransferase
MGILRKLGYQLLPAAARADLYTGELGEVLERVMPYTRASRERVAAAFEAARYVAQRGVPGAIVECGVWRGGCSMAMAFGMLDASVNDREFFLFDTFAGMTEPTADDRKVSGLVAIQEYAARRRDDGGSDWCFAREVEVRAAMAATGYRTERIHLIKGRVEDTIPRNAPSEIAVLRLDTDWYESTRHELVHLYPRLVPGGILLLDDYGEWLGARRAVDEYFVEHPPQPLLNRIDFSGRLAVKL